VGLDLLVLLGDEEQRDTLLALDFEPTPKSLTLLRIERRGRLVEQQRIRFAEQRDREVEPLAVADRKVRPSEGSSAPASSASSVDLPAPFGPTSATASPSLSSKSVGSSAICEP
jgi:hypothetical protein